MDRLDRLILDCIQNSFPVDHRPYEQIGLEYGITEHEAWQRISNLRSTGVIRRIGGVFDSRSLGYVSTLCAAAVPENKVQELAEFMMGIMEITHNYLRNHPKYNLWFTIIASSSERLQEILAGVSAVLGSNEVYSLPAARIFKIGVQFDLSKERKRCPFNSVEKRLTSTGRPDYNDDSKELRLKKPDIKNLTEEDKAMIRLLQDDLPSSLQPYHEWATVLNINPDAVLAKTELFLNNGIMRRLGAILIHHNAGYTSNGMGVWIVPEHKIKEVGTKMATFKEVTHCYHRPTLPDWPYNVFTMVHGHSDEECREIIDRISDLTGIREYDLLFSHTELKKSSMRYFA